MRTTGHYLMEVGELTTSPLTLAPSCAHPEFGSEPQGCDQPYRTIPPLAFQALGVVFRSQSSGSTPPGIASRRLAAPVWTHAYGGARRG